MQPNWFLLRGLTREAAHWETFPAHFQKAFPTAKIHCIDLPGSGVNWKVKSPLTIEDNVVSLRREYKRLVPEKGPCYIFALSLGGMVTIEWLRRHPEDFAAGVLVNTSLRRVSPFYRRLSPAAMLAVARIATLPKPRDREKAILELTSSQPKFDDAFLDRREEVFKKHPFTRANFLRQLAAAARYQPPSQRPSVPLLLLNSLGDKLVNPLCSNDLQRRWKVDLKTHPTAGHDLPLDDPEWTVKCVHEWITGMTRLQARG